MKPLGEHPGQCGGGGGDVGRQQRHAGIGVGRQSAARVEAEPADPQHGGAGHGQPRIVRRPVVLRVASAPAQHGGDDQGGDAGGGMDHQAAGKIHHPELGQPAAAPHPVGDRRIDNDDPEHAKQEHGAEFHALGVGADNQRRGDNGERHLKHEKDGFGYIAA